MAGFLMSRFLSLVAVLVVALSLTFVVLRLSPGGPFSGERNLTAEQIAERELQYGLNGTLPEQLGRWWGRALQGDLNESIKSKNFTVTEILAQSLPVSFTLGGLAFLLAGTGGVVWGTLAAMRKNRLADRLSMAGALLAISLPSFLTGPLLVLVFGLVLQWFPAGGWSTARHVVLPAVCLAVPYAAYVARLMRNSMVEVLGADFIRAARARGLPEWRVVLFHALKPTLVPLVSYLAPAVAGVMTGSIVIEQIFGLPGVGRYFFQGALSRDYPLVMGVVIVYASAVLVMNLLADLAYAALDPRIRRGFSAGSTT